MLGALLAFAFLSGQCFGVELAKSVWKQILGDKLCIEDVLEVDEEAYHLLRSLTSDETGADNPKLDKAVKNYFAKYNPQVKAINEGMNIVLKDKLNVIAYLPLTKFIERICGLPTVEIEDLKEITEYIGTRNREQEAWFWQILEEFDQQHRAQYLIFVNAKARLPNDLKTAPKHKYQVYKEQRGVKDEVKMVKGANGKVIKKTLKDQPYVKYERDSLPITHTCDFKIDMMEYSTLEDMREKLLYAMKNAEGISD